jgi:hypothetical protein
MARVCGVEIRVLVVHCLLIMRNYITHRQFASDAHFDATASASL